MYDCVLLCLYMYTAQCFGVKLAHVYIDCRNSDCTRLLVNSNIMCVVSIR